MVHLPNDLIFTVQCHPPTVSQFLNEFVASAEDIRIRDAKKGDIEPRAISLFLPVKRPLFRRAMDGAVDLDCQTNLRDEEIYNPPTTDDMLPGEATLQQPAIERTEDAAQFSFGRRRTDAHALRVSPHV